MPPPPEGEEECAAAGQELLREQLECISASVCRVTAPVRVGAGAAGSTPYRTASQMAFTYSEDAVARMRADGELGAQHHRRRDEMSAYAECCARSSLLGRGSSPPKQ